MNLSFLSRILPHRTKRDLFLAILLAESSGVCFVYEKTVGDVQLVSEQAFTYSDGFTQLLDDIDKVVYTFEKNLKYQFRKALFVVPSLALATPSKEIAQPYRSAISDILHTLEFEPMGYIELIDCLKSKLEETHSNAYIEMGKEDCLLVFSRRSQHWKTLVVKSHLANVVNHLDEFLSKGTPVYIRTLHDSIEGTKLVPAISTYSVYLCTHEDVTVGLLNVLKTQLLVEDEAHTEQETNAASTENIQERKTNIDTTLPQTGTPPAEEVLPDDTPMEVEGFKIVAMPTSTPTGVVDTVSNPPARNEEPNMELDQTFTSNSDQNQISDTEEDPILDEQIVETTSESSEDDDDSYERPIRKTFSPVVLVRSLVLTLLVAGLAIFSSLAVVEAIIHKVTVRVTLNTELIDIQTSLADIPLAVLSDEKELKVSVNATGEKQVGDRAKGTVTLASFDDKQASFSAGTTLSIDGNPYQLDQDVVLPASTIDTASGTKTAAKKSVAASALFIGEEGNLDKGKQFKIEQYPTSLYYAVSESAFTGGSTRTVSVVSAVDMATLTSQVTKKGKELSDTARNGARESSIVLEDISTIDLSKISYSARVGEIASRVEAVGIVTALLSTVEKSSLQQALQNTLVKEKGSDFKLAEDIGAITYSNIEVSDSKDTVSFNVKAKVKTYKEPDTKAVVRASRLKPLSQARENILKTVDATDVSFAFAPILPIFDLFTPYQEKHIEVVFSPQ